MNPTDIVFSEEQQQALLGYALTDVKIFEAAGALGVNKNWYFNQNDQAVWQALSEFHDEHSRAPTEKEFRQEQCFIAEEKQIVTARLKALDRALGLRADIGYDTLVIQLREWAKAQRFVKGMQESADLYARKDVAAAYNVVAAMNLDMERIDKQGLAARCQDSATRSLFEREERMEQAPKVLQYGISYLDEATGGIGSNDLVLIGAKTGVGKTECVIKIASTNAVAGKRVALFALEAEEFEVERRLKYKLLAKLYRIKTPNPKPTDYAAWRLGKLEAELGPYEDQANKSMKAYKNLNTIYRKGGNYGVEELERDIIRLASTTDLIIVDHLHYVDLDGDDENAGVKKILKKLRDLCIGLGKPIILVAHMRKSYGGKNQPLIPGLEDFHGSSDIIKIATTAIILAPCWVPVRWGGAFPDTFKDPTDPHVMATIWPTFVRIAKCRLDGSRLRYAAIAWYDPAIGAYRDEYAIGELTSGECHWQPVEKRPYWAQKAVLSLQSTND